MNGFTDEQIKELESRGWIKGTACGYKLHEGFVHDYRTPSARGHYDLKPAKKGRFQFADIENGICTDKKYMLFSEVLEYFNPESS